MSKKNKLHIGKDGTPRKCKAVVVRCPLAHPLAHFAKQEDAENFADRYNELKVQGMDYTGLNNRDIEKLDDAELVYISEHIKENAASNDEYSDYYNQARWQKTERNRAVNKLTELENRNQAILRELEGSMDRVDSLREKYLSTEDKEERKKAQLEYVMARSALKARLSEAATETVQNQKEYRKTLDKKEQHENKMIDYLDKRVKHQEIKDVEEAVDTEIGERVDSRNARESFDSMKNGEVEYKDFYNTIKGKEVGETTILAPDGFDKSYIQRYETKDYVYKVWNMRGQKEFSKNVELVEIEDKAGNYITGATIN